MSPTVWEGTGHRVPSRPDVNPHKIYLVLGEALLAAVLLDDRPSCAAKDIRRCAPERDTRCKLLTALIVD